MTFFAFLMPGALLLRHPLLPQMLQQEQQASAEAASAAQAAAEELRSQLAEAEAAREASLAEAAAAAEAEAAQLRGQLEQAQAQQQSLGGEQAALQAQLEALAASHQQVTRLRDWWSREWATPAATLHVQLTCLIQPAPLSLPCLLQDLAALGEENLKLMELLEGRQVRNGSSTQRFVLRRWNRAASPVRQCTGWQRLCAACLPMFWLLLTLSLHITEPLLYLALLCRSSWTLRPPWLPSCAPLPSPLPPTQLQRQRHCAPNWRPPRQCCRRSRAARMRRHSGWSQRLQQLRSCRAAWPPLRQSLRASASWLRTWRTGGQLRLLRLPRLPQWRPISRSSWARWRVGWLTARQRRSPCASSLRSGMRTWRAPPARRPHCERCGHGGWVCFCTCCTCLLQTIVPLLVWDAPNSIILSGSPPPVPFYPFPAGAGCPGCRSRGAACRAGDCGRGCGWQGRGSEEVQAAGGWLAGQAKGGCFMVGCSRRTGLVLAAPKIWCCTGQELQC